MVAEYFQLLNAEFRFELLQFLILKKKRHYYINLITERCWFKKIKKDLRDNSTNLSASRWDCELINDVDKQYFRARISCVSMIFSFTIYEPKYNLVEVMIQEFTNLKVLTYTCSSNSLIFFGTSISSSSILASHSSSPTKPDWKIWKN